MVSHATFRDSSAQGRLDEVRPLLEEALDLSLAARNTPIVTLSLSAYAWLAFAEGNPERAARLEGAAEGLRRRVGLRAWPHLRRVEADLVAQVRHRLGVARFDQAFSAGTRLTRREAVAVVRDQPSPARAPRRPEPLRTRARNRGLEPGAEANRHRLRATAPRRQASPAPTPRGLAPRSSRQLSRQAVHPA